MPALRLGPPQAGGAGKQHKSCRQHRDAQIPLIGGHANRLVLIELEYICKSRPNDVQGRRGKDHPGRASEAQGLPALSHRAIQKRKPCADEHKGQKIADAHIRVAHGHDGFKKFVEKIAQCGTPPCALRREQHAQTDRIGEGGLRRRAHDRCYALHVRRAAATQTSGHNARRAAFPRARAGSLPCVRQACVSRRNPGQRVEESRILAQRQYRQRRAQRQQRKAIPHGKQQRPRAGEATQHTHHHIRMQKVQPARKGSEHAQRHARCPGPAIPADASAAPRAGRA